MKLDECTLQEQWVLEQLEQGEEADLVLGWGPDFRSRRLRAKFLEALLTDDIECFKPHRRGIRIFHAVVAEPLDLENADIEHIVVLAFCTFQAKVNGMDSRWQKVVNLHYSKFLGEVDFHRLKAGSAFFCQRAVFQGPVDFGSADIGGQFIAEGAEFKSETETASFNRLKVGRDASFRGAVFQGPVDFRGADIGGQFIAEGAEFKSETETASFNSLKVGRTASFQGAVFQGPVDFRGADIGGQCIAMDAEFKSQTGTATFSGLKVAQDAFFEGAVFQGPVDFQGIQVGDNFYLDPSGKEGKQPTEFKDSVTFAGADIGGHFIAKGAEFKSETATASFNGLKVGLSAFFEEAVFQGPVDFGGADIGGQFSAKGAEFKSETKTASFNSLKVGQYAFFDGAVFQGPVDFGGAAIGGQFSALRAQFQSETAMASFNSLKVGRDAFFRGAIFHGSANFDFLETEGSFYIDTKNGEQPTIFKGEAKFGGANIGEQFLANQAIFCKNADFGGLQVKDRCIFNESVFKTNAFFYYSLIKDLNIIGESSFITLNLCHAKIERELILSGLTLSKLEMWNAHCKGHADLRGLKIEESCSMQDSYFLSLTLREVIWPPREKTNLEGLTYKAISAGERHEDWRKLLEWIEAARFNIQPYNQLEAYLRSCGHQDRADKVFIAGKRRAANQLIWWKRWLTKLFWGKLTGYGRRPWKVLWVIVPTVVFGAWLFPPEFTAKFTESHSWLRDMTASHPWIIKFLLSLDRFLPGVDLGLAKEWSPSSTGIGLGAFAYWYFLKLIGWITIPIALAAIYTRIK